MPRFTPDFSTVTVATPIHPRGSYRVTIIRVNGMAYTKEDGVDVAGVRYSLKMVGKVLSDGTIDDALAGQDVAPVRLYVHSEGAMNMTKQTLMAFFGYLRKDEKTFNKEVLGKGSDFAIEEGEGENAAAIIGDSWKDCVGNEVNVVLDLEDYNDQEQQKHKNFTAIA